MRPDFDVLLQRYESGQLSRRDLLGALAVLCVPFKLGSGVEPAIGTAKTMNHVTCRVSDVARSQKFYQELFGMPVLTQQAPGVNLRVGGSFLGLYPVDAGDAPRIDHFCLGLDQFDADGTREKLAARGLTAVIRVRGDTKELYFNDPDGLRVQLQDVRYRGGVGPIGDKDPT
jgi:catechol 2,3-dioxygenase-like lactoylglutathione lyase family enzyme